MGGRLQDWPPFQGSATMCLEAEILTKLTGDILCERIQTQTVHTV